MDAEITRLERQIEQLIALHESGKTELRQLRNRVVALEAENRQLSEKLKVAIERLEGMLVKLPVS
jgi:prefoldin subunit 5